MDRRTFVTTMAGALLHARLGEASTACQPTPFGSVCRSEIRFDRFLQAYAPQRASQWCWAASVSMIFGYYGRPVSQERVVESVYGRQVNLPAMSGFTIATQLNRNWQDDYGRPFTSRVTAAYDFDAGVVTLTNAMIVRELDAERPIVIGTANHAVVVTAIDYIPTHMGPNIRGVGVFDPFPGFGARPLNQAEMTPMHLGGGLRFVATVSVR